MRSWKAVLLIVIIAVIMAGIVILISVSTSPGGAPPTVPRPDITPAPTSARAGFPEPAQAPPALADLIAAVERDNFPRPVKGVPSRAQKIAKIVEYEENHRGALHDFILNPGYGPGPRITALQAFDRFAGADCKRYGEVIETAGAVLAEKSGDSRVAVLKQVAAGVVARGARLWKVDKKLYEKSLEILLDRFARERDTRVLYALLSKLTAYGKADILVPKMKARFHALDMSDPMQVQLGAQIIRAIAAIWSGESDDFLETVAAKNRNATLRAAAVDCFNGRTSEWAVPKLEKLREHEQDPLVLKAIDAVLAKKRR